MPLVARAPSNFFPETGVSLFPRTDDPSTIPPPNFPIFYFVKFRGSEKKKEKNYDSYLNILLFSRILIDLCQERKKANNIPLLFIEIVFDRLKDRRGDFFLLPCVFHASSSLGDNGTRRIEATAETIRLSHVSTVAAREQTRRVRFSMPLRSTCNVCTPGSS